MSIELLTYNHKEKLTEAFERSHRKIDIVSPFLSEDTADYFSKLIKKKQIPATFITRFDHEAFVKGANSTKGLTKMLHAGVELLALLGLHTKLYLIDDRTAILGSANLTESGMSKNIELSLYIEDEPELFDFLQKYFEKLRDVCREQETYITEERLKHEDQLVKEENTHSKYAGPCKTTVKPFGAKLPASDDELDRDYVQELLNPQINYDSHCWIKFEASSRERRSSGGPYTFHEQNGIYMTRFSQARKPKRMHEGDIVYIAVHSRDRNGNPAPMIVGRARCHVFRETNVIPDGGQWPVYLELYDVEPCAGNIQDGICLYDLVDALGKDTYTHTQGREMPAESIRYSHRQQAYLGLTDTAEKYLEQIFKPRDKES